MFQKDSALAEWYRRRTANAPSMRKTFVVALARKLLIALWRLAGDGVVPEGVRLVPLHDRRNPLTLSSQVMASLPSARA